MYIWNGALQPACLTVREIGKIQKRLQQEICHNDIIIIILVRSIDIEIAQNHCKIWFLYFSWLLELFFSNTAVIILKLVSPNLDKTHF